jgi:hypothetical protein
MILYYAIWQLCKRMTLSDAGAAMGPTGSGMSSLLWHLKKRLAYYLDRTAARSEEKERERRQRKREREREREGEEEYVV